MEHFTCPKVSLGGSMVVMDLGLEGKAFKVQFGGKTWPKDPPKPKLAPHSYFSLPHCHPPHLSLPPFPLCETRKPKKKPEPPLPPHVAAQTVKPLVVHAQATARAVHPSLLSRHPSFCFGVGGAQPKPS